MKVPRDQPVSVLSDACDAVVAPDAIRFAIQKVDGLNFTLVKDGQIEMANGADVLDVEDDAVRRSFGDAHLVGGFARKVIGLFKIELFAFRHFLRGEIFAALTGLQAGESVRVHN
jgi:hypothetical protein